MDRTTAALVGAFVGSVILAVLMLFGVLLWDMSRQQPVRPQVPPQAELPPPPPPKRPTVRDALATISADLVRGYVTRLASDDFQGRLAGSRGNDLAAKFIGDTMKEAGVQVEYQSFQFRGARTQNVVGWLDGKSDQVVVLGAHFDHMGPNRPGADDNASGTAAVMAAAKAYALLTQRKPLLSRTVSFQLYSAEELGMHGSAFYVRNPILPKSGPDIRKHYYMLNLDMVGHVSNMRTRTCASGIPNVEALVQQLSSKYPFAGKVTDAAGSSGASDHYSFMQAGVPVSWLHTGMHQRYHQASDTAATLDYDGLAAVAKYAVELTLSIAQTREALSPVASDVASPEVDHGGHPFPAE